MYVYDFIIDDSDLCHGPEFEDDQKQIVQRGIFDSLTESSGAASNSQEKQTLLFNSEPDAGTIFSRFSNFSNDKPRAQSLPRIYKMTINPSLDEDGNAWRYVHKYTVCNLFYRFLYYYTRVHNYVP